MKLKEKRLELQLLFFQLSLTSRIKQIPIVIIEPNDVNKLDKQSLIRVPDVCTFDKRRLKNKIGELSPNKMKEVDKKLKIHLG